MLSSAACHRRVARASSPHGCCCLRPATLISYFDTTSILGLGFTVSWLFVREIQTWYAGLITNVIFPYMVAYNYSHKLPNNPHLNQILIFVYEVFQSVDHNVSVL